MDIDIKKLIHEVEIRPPIWNVNISQFSDRRLKQELWYDIVDVFEAEFHDEDRPDIAEILQRKWRNIRDTFIREIKPNAKRKTKYVYYDNLSFIKNMARKHKSYCESDGSETEQPCPPVTTRKKIKIKKETRQSEKLYTPKAAAQSTSRTPEFVLVKPETLDNLEEDGDRLFFLSLVKDFRKIPEQRKLQTKLDLIKVIQNAQEVDKLD